jgi:hypothetical protein
MHPVVSRERQQLSAPPAPFALLRRHERMFHGAADGPRL